ncbi:hypothetical protein MAM1_0154d06749 [Mucor ambiguus]|uniref:Uncharacterized protein n=1 Tax=Mucor ambiguus TaxID=91626 RepID=A0A0C9MIR5_9FUNG|nr:hypothetical protein MAM1_0154d06749 [Mucor ambiguus]
MTRFEAITCQWEKTKLIIFATRRLADDKYLVYKKGIFQFPKSPNHSGEFAQLILSYFFALTSITQLQESQFNHGDVLFRSDSTTAINASDAEHNIKQDDEDDVKTYGDWEEFLMQSF